MNSIDYVTITQEYRYGTTFDVVAYSFALTFSNLICLIMQSFDFTFKFLGCHRKVVF